MESENMAEMEIPMWKLSIYVSIVVLKLFVSSVYSSSILMMALLKLHYLWNR